MMILGSACGAPTPAIVSRAHHQRTALSFCHVPLAKSIRMRNFSFIFQWRRRAPLGRDWAKSCRRRRRRRRRALVAANGGQSSGVIVCARPCCVALLRNNASRNGAEIVQLNSLSL
jgi:transcription initiation factor TFIIIB Brf1 subunit/transcription initiation factor TFIIB